MSKRVRLAAAMMIAAGLCAPSFAQTPPPAQPAASCVSTGIIPSAPRFPSVEQHPDGRVTFRLCAPDAKTVKITSSDIADIIPMGVPDGPVGLPLTRGDGGVWSVTTDRPVAADVYRFNFNVDGARVPDPQGTRFSQERFGTNGIFEVTGAAGDFQAWHKEVPHGAVATIDYWSPALGIQRRMHVYTPPGYMNGTARYPVLYLVHGAGDSDDSWTSIGHANQIIDNLIAAGRATPMIIVMPFGHTPDRAGGDMLNNQDFGADLLRTVVPTIDATYRTIRTADARAMAGLSMGGAHTIRFGLTHPETFHAVGIFSMGLGLQGPDELPGYEAANAAALARSAKAMKLVYYAIGKADFLYRVAAPTRAMLDRHGIRYVYNETEGGHTWINWRRYLDDFAPRLFR